jgi:hypothetical protein
MVKKVPINKSPMARFNFAELDGIKKEMKKRPELEKKLRKDLIGTLKAEGIVVDNDFMERAKKAWQAQIRADVRGSVAKSPESKNWYLRRVVEGKPIVVHVKIDRKTGKHEKTLLEGT